MKTKINENFSRLPKKGQLMQLDPKTINAQSGIQVRLTLDQKIVDEYADLMRDGVEFPPVKVVTDDTDEHFMFDGFHRLAAHLLVDPTKPITIESVPGTLNDAIWLAIGANATHGLPLSNEDKRNAAIKALEHPKVAGMSDRAIAKYVGVSHTFIATIRNETNQESTGNGCQLSEQTGDQSAQFVEVSENRQEEKRVGADGKTRRLPHKKERPTPPVVEDSVDHSPDDAPHDDVNMLKRVVQSLLDDLNKRVSTVRSSVSSSKKLKQEGKQRIDELCDTFQEEMLEKVQTFVNDCDGIFAAFESSSFFKRIQEYARHEKPLTPMDAAILHVIANE